MADPDELLAFLRSSSGLPYIRRRIWFYPWSAELLPPPPSSTISWHNSNTARARGHLNSKPWLAGVLAGHASHPRTSPPSARSELALPAFAKPPGGCGGRGIFLVRTPADLLEVPSSYVIQEGVMLPTMRDGCKVDYRVFVLISSDGLCAIHRLALARPSAVPYDVESSDPLVQLTNSSVHGEQGLFTEELPITALAGVLDAIRIVQPAVGLRANEFAIVGADVIVQDGKALLLELNAAWDRQVSNAACAAVKSRALFDLLSLRAGSAASPLLLVARPDT